MRTGLLVVAVVVAVLSGCSVPPLSSRHGVYEVVPERVSIEGREIRATYVRPVVNRHPEVLVVFFTGDGGWHRTSSELFRHLAEQGYTVAGFSSDQILKPFARTGEKMAPARAAQGLKKLYTEVKRDLGLPDSTPIMVVGYSRGASMVAFTAVHPELQGGVAGAVSVALVREADYLQVPDGVTGPAIQVSSTGHLQLYPLLKLLGSLRLAVIQSTNDHYVTAAESRQLLGPDTDTLRLYTVEARNHRFSNARDKLMQDLDDALLWVKGSAAIVGHPSG
jgi:dienelactone hydrolase